MAEPTRRAMKAMKKKPTNTGAVCAVCGGPPQSMGVVADLRERGRLAHANVCFQLWQEVRAEAMRSNLDVDEAEAWMIEELARLRDEHAGRIAEQFLSAAEVARRHAPRTDSIRVGKPPSMSRRLDGHR